MLKDYVDGPICIKKNVETRKFLTMEIYFIQYQSPKPKNL